MITGDYEETALAISKEIHLVDHEVQLNDTESNVIISGNDWDKINKNDLKETIREAVKNK